MQTQSFEAIYVDGVIKPLQDLNNISEHSKLKVTISSIEEERESYSEFIGMLNHEQAREMIDVINEEFGKIDVNGW